eukprot:2263186-Pyramimonas_sp.AAC.1
MLHLTQARVCINNFFGGINSVLRDNVQQHLGDNASESTGDRRSRTQGTYHRGTQRTSRLRWCLAGAADSGMSSTSRSAA